MVHASKSTVPIWGSDRPKFGRPEETYRRKSVCVTGKIKEYRGVPEIVASARANQGSDRRTEVKAVLIHS